MLENDPTTDCLMRDFLQHFSNVKLSEGGQDYVFEIVDDDYLQKMAHTLMEARRESAQVQHTFYTLSDKILTNDGPNGAAIILDAGDVNQNDLEKALRFVLNDNLYSVSNPDGTIIGAAFSQYSSAPRAALQHNTPFPNNLCPRGTSQEQYTENFNRF
jgi:hypothetical protein